MSTREKTFNPERGERIKQFRRKVLKLDQNQVAAATEKSQTAISMVEKGQMPPQEVIDFYAEQGASLNWLFLGKGPVYLKDTGNKVNEAGESYDTLSGFIQHAISNEPLDIYISNIQKTTEAYYKVVSAKDLTTEERNELFRSIVDKVDELTREIKSKLI